MDAKNLVFERFSKVLGVPMETLSEDMAIAEAVDDSLTYFELFLELEKELGKSVSFEEVIAIKTLGDAVLFVDKEKNVIRSEK
jgi:acyl carrier protein